MDKKEKFYTGSISSEKLNETLYLSAYHIGSGSSCTLFKNMSIFLIDEEKDLCRQIVDKWGNIRNFPNIDYCSLLVSECGGKIEPKVNYEACFGKFPDGRFMMVWTVRPDGAYWMDSFGFGEEDYDEVRLYTYIDRDGNFTRPFKLYSIGEKHYGEYKLG